MKGGARSLGSRIGSRIGGATRAIATAFLPSHYFVRSFAGDVAVTARVDAVRDENGDTRTLTLSPGRGWRTHRAGQHVRVSLAIDGRIATRMYAIASSPDRADGRIELTVKAREGGRVARALARELAPGAGLALGLPEGELVIDEGAPVRALLVTAGIGIAPVMSMLRTFHARGAMPDVVHLHHARTARDEIFGDELRALASAHPSYRLTVVHTGGDPRRLSPGRLDELAPDWRVRDGWACGPAGLLDAVTACFAGEHREHALRLERWAAAIAPVPATTAGGGLVTFAASGARVRADGKTPLLRVAEDAGLAVPHGCRMGVCHTCDATMVSGCVRDLRTGESIAEPGTRIQVCVCAAAGDVELAL